MLLVRTRRSRWGTDEPLCPVDVGGGAGRRRRWR